MKIIKEDRVFSIYIRLRDSDENGYRKCITCENIRFWKNMDCGHYIKRQHQGTRFNEQNCHAQCKNCNWTLQGNDSVYKEKIIELYGQEKHDLLKSSERTYFKRTKLELDLLAKEYQGKIKELMKTKNFEL